MAKGEGKKVEEKLKNIYYEKFIDKSYCEKTLEIMTFVGCNFKKVDLTKIKFVSCVFIDCKIDEVSLKDCVFDSCLFSECKVSNLFGSESEIKKSNILYSTLFDFDFSDIFYKVESLVFSSCQVFSVFMNFANYTDVIFRNTCVARSTLVGVSQEKLEEIFKTSSFAFDTALDLIDEKKQWNTYYF